MKIAIAVVLAFLFMINLADDFEEKLMTGAPITHAVELITPAR